jgi:hypothetical protein
MLNAEDTVNTYKSTIYKPISGHCQNQKDMCCHFKRLDSLRTISVLLVQQSRPGSNQDASMGKESCRMQSLVPRSGDSGSRYASRQMKVLVLVLSRVSDTNLLNIPSQCQ